MRQALIPAVAIAIVALSATVSADDPEPLTLSAVSNRETCTLGSVTTIDYTIEGGVPPYRLTVDGREVATGTDPGLIPCHDSTTGSPFESISAAGARYIAVNVSDSVGNHAFNVVEVPLVPPLPAPQNLHVISDLHWRSGTLFSVVWRVRHLPPIALRDQVAIRWRKQGDSDWTVELHQGRETMDLWYRASWQADTSSMGEQREVQAALLRHMLDLRTPDAMQWTPTVTVTTAAQPHELQAEASHDEITLSWGPHAPGLAYVARLEAVHGTYRDYEELRLTNGPLFEARFGDLLPDTLYRVEVRLDHGDGYRSPIDQHRFEIRTEPAPAGWSPPSRSATNITANLSDGELQVTWTPPSTGSRYETRVCARPADNWWAGSCDTAGPGDAHARVPLDRWQKGGTFAVSIEVGSLPAGVAEVDVHAPSYEPDLPTRGAPPEAPQFFKVSWSHIHHEDPKPATWRFRWDHEDADLAEVSWQEDGRRIIRETRDPEFSISLTHAQVPEAVRVRLLKDNVWTPWSDEADVARVDNSQRNVRFVELDGTLEVHWDPPVDDSKVIGYRLYLTRNHREERVIDLGRQVRVQISVVPTDEWISVNVATLYEGPLEVVHFSNNWYLPQRQTRQPEPLQLHVYTRPTMCPPAESAYAQVHWNISGGAWPYTVSIGDRLGFETHGDSGYSVVECRTGSDGLLQEIPVSVMDAAGQSAEDIVGPEDVLTHSLEGQEDPFQITFGPRSVYRDRIWLTWEFCGWPYDAALRWRVSGTEAWSYALDFPFDNHAYGLRCSGMLDGLAPSTTYEYQLARYISAEQLRHPDRLPWSVSQIVTTLGPPKKLSIARDRETVRVSWQRQPDAWAYLVGLRAEGRSWWKRYEPQGDTIETVYFYRVPQDLELSVEVISPPLKRGEEEIPLEVDPRWSLGH